MTAIMYHSIDPDGWCSAVLMYIIANEFYLTDADEIRMIPWNYGDDMPDLSDVDSLMVGDLSFTKEQWKEIYTHIDIDSIYWWDHHKYKFGEGNSNIKGVRSSEHSAAKLIHEWMKDHTPLLIERYAGQDVVDMVSKYDTWTHNNDPQILAFSEGIRSGAGTKPKNYWDRFEWKKLLAENQSDHLLDVLRRGTIIMKKMTKMWNDELCKGRSMVTVPIGKHHLMCFVVNSTLSPNLMFDSMKDRNKYDLCMTWYVMNDGGVKVSCRSLDDSAFKFADAYGGGGHDSAAGCHFDDVSMFMGELTPTVEE